MKGRLSSMVLLTLALSWTALAQMQSPMREGNWEVTMKMSMPGMGMEMPPMKQTSCVTAAMIKDPQSSVPKGPGGSDCKVSDYKFTSKHGHLHDGLHEADTHDRRRRNEVQRERRLYRDHHGRYRRTEDVDGLRCQAHRRLPK